MKGMGSELTDLSSSPSSLCSCQIKLSQMNLTRKEFMSAMESSNEKFGLKSGLCYLGRNVRDLGMSLFLLQISYFSVKREVDSANLMDRSFQFLLHIHNISQATSTNHTIRSWARDSELHKYQFDSDHSYLEVCFENTSKFFSGQ